MALADPNLIRSVRAQLEKALDADAFDDLRFNEGAARARRAMGKLLHAQPKDSMTAVLLEATRCIVGVAHGEPDFLDYAQKFAHELQSAALSAIRKFGHDIRPDVIEQIQLTALPKTEPVTKHRPAPKKIIPTMEWEFDPAEDFKNHYGEVNAAIVSGVMKALHEAADTGLLTEAEMEASTIPELVAKLVDLLRDVCRLPFTATRDAVHTLISNRIAAGAVDEGCELPTQQAAPAVVDAFEFTDEGAQATTAVLGRVIQRQYDRLEEFEARDAHRRGVLGDLISSSMNEAWADAELTRLRTEEARLRSGIAEIRAAFSTKASSPDANAACESFVMALDELTGEPVKGAPMEEFASIAIGRQYEETTGHRFVKVTSTGGRLMTLLGLAPGLYALVDFPPGALVRLIPLARYSVPFYDIDIGREFAVQGGGDCDLPLPLADGFGSFKALTLGVGAVFEKISATVGEARAGTGVHRCTFTADLLVELLPEASPTRVARKERVEWATVPSGRVVESRGGRYRRTGPLTMDTLIGPDMTGHVFPDRQIVTLLPEGDGI